MKLFSINYNIYVNISFQTHMNQFGKQETEIEIRTESKTRENEITTQTRENEIFVSFNKKRK